MRTIISWNCRGLGDTDSSKVLYIQYMINKYNPMLVFLSETKLSVAQAIAKLGLQSTQSIGGHDSVGLSGGLLVVGFNVLSCNVVFSSSNLCVCKILEHKKSAWYVFCVYGAPAVQDRPQVWNTLSQFLQNYSNTVLLGDFNQVEYTSDKIGGSQYIQGWNEFISWRLSNSLQEIQFGGPRYTWSNGRDETNTIMERIDRGYMTNDWIQIFPNSFLEHHPILFSDHAAIILHFDRNHSKKWSTYKLDNWCLEIPQIRRMIESIWSSNPMGSSMFRLSRKLDIVRKELLKWCISHRQFKGIQWNSELEKLNQMATEIDDITTGSAFWKKRNETVENMRRTYLYWQQRAKLKWITQGDIASKLFFAYTKSRAKRSEIRMMKNEQDVWLYSTKEIENHILTSFKKIFRGEDRSSTSDPPDNNWRNMFPTVLSNSDRLQLSKAFTPEEIKEGFFEQGNLKSPGHDGITVEFYKKYWDVVGMEVTEAVNLFFTSRYILREWNKTIITLIPKCQDPETISHFRPISLCNTVYKAISKCMVNRLKMVLPNIVSENQFAFLKGRQISENCLVAAELMHYINTRKQGNSYFAVIKIDMNKAYDRVNWNMLIKIMESLGFPPCWIEWVWECIATVSYRISVNGSLSKTFKPTCGIRQGDPLSPFLFLLCMELLTRLLKKGEEGKQIEGIRITRRAPMITHLLYADDALIFIKINDDKCKEISRILQEFCGISGEMINLNKSCIKFSPNTPLEVRNECKEQLRMPTSTQLGHHLGLPMDMKKSKTSEFGFLVDRILQKIDVWSNIKVNQAGKMVLINAMLISVCYHTFSAFKVPDSICNKIDSILYQFWCRNDFKKRSFCLIKKSSLHKPKGMGGLGLRKTSHLNTAFLIKQAHCIQGNKFGLLGRTFSSKYNFLHNLKTKVPPRPPRNSSWAGRSLYSGMKHLQQGVRWKIGGGRSLDILQFPWNDTFQVRDDIPINFLLNTKIHDLIDWHRHKWDSLRLNFIYGNEVANHIMEHEFGNENADDTPYWPFHSDGHFSIKSAYAFLQWQDNETLFPVAVAEQNFWKHLWAFDLLPKWKTFTWKLLNSGLPVAERLYQRGMRIEPQCPFCHQENETDLHLFCECSFTRHIWRASQLGLIIQNNHITSVKQWFLHLFSYFYKQHHRTELVRTLVGLCWHIWIHRNSVLFQGTTPNPNAVLCNLASNLDLVKEALNTQINSPMAHAYGLATEHNENQMQAPPGFLSCQIGMGNASDNTATRCLIDGAWNPNSHEMGNGWVIMSSREDIQHIQGYDKGRARTAIQTECQSLRLALQEAKAHEVQAISIWTDSILLVQMLKSSDKIDSSCERTITHIKDLAKTFLYCRVTKVSRNMILPAHKLAVQGRREQEDG